MRYTVRPLHDRTWLRGDHQRQQSRFDTTWSKTLKQLEREIDLLGGRDIVLEVDVQERHIRNDGMLRADAKAASPAVVVAFETRSHGPMLYRCDRYTRNWRASGSDWQENVRAIALTLEALRAVDRYGATETGQQYAGFKALPSGTAMGPSTSSHLTATDAQTRLLAIAGLTSWPTTEAELTRAVTLAKRAAHPDRNNGDHTTWRDLAEALLVLRLDR